MVQLVEALRYTSESRGFDARSGRTMAHALTELGARDISWGAKVADFLERMEASIPQRHTGHFSSVVC